MYLINKKIVIRSWLLFIICGQCWANESAVYITFLNIYQSPEPNYYDLDLTFNISLSKKLIKALENSVPLTFEVEVSVHEKRDWLWDKKIKTVNSTFELNPDRYWCAQWKDFVKEISGLEFDKLLDIAL